MLCSMLCAVCCVLCALCFVLRALCSVCWCAVGYVLICAVCCTWHRHAYSPDMHSLFLICFWHIPRMLSTYSNHEFRLHSKHVLRKNHPQHESNPSKIAYAHSAKHYVMISYLQEFGAPWSKCLEKTLRFFTPLLKTS